MFRQLSLTDLVAAVKSRIETGTSLPCYDVPPENAAAPFVFVEIAALRPADTKTMYCKRYTLWLHVIAEEKASSVPVYQYIQDVQEALTEDIALPEEFTLVYQSDNGIQMINTDETGEKHAVLEFEFVICFAYKTK